MSNTVLLSRVYQEHIKLWTYMKKKRWLLGGKKIKIKTTVKVGKMVQWVKILSAKPENLNSICGGRVSTAVWWEEEQTPVSSPIATSTPRQMHPSFHALHENTKNLKSQYEKDYPGITRMENQKHQVLARMWNNWGPHSLLREMKGGLTSSEKS